MSKYHLHVERAQHVHKSANVPFAGDRELPPSHVLQCPSLLLSDNASTESIWRILVIGVAQSSFYFFLGHT